MSRISQPLSRPPQYATERKRLTSAQIEILRQRQNWRCGCGCGMSFLIGYKEGRAISGPVIDEHILPLDLGGSNDLDNRALYLPLCARTKTKDDIARIRKAARLRRDSDPETRRQTKFKIRGRGFPKADELK